MSTLDDLKKPTGFTGGVAFGGGDTPYAKFPQPAYLGVLLTALTPSKTVALPAGTSIYGYMITPDFTSPSAGTVDVGFTGSLDAYVADGVLTAPSKADLTTAVKLAADQDVIFNATGLVGGNVYVTLQIVQPVIEA